MLKRKTVAQRPMISLQGALVQGHSVLGNARLAAMRPALVALVALVGAACSQGTTNPLATGAVGPEAPKSSVARANSVEMAPLALPAESQKVADRQMAPGRSEPMSVTLMLPMTGSGQLALIADSMKKAAELALTDLGASNVSLVVRDDRGTPEGATAVVTELLAQGSPEIVLGPFSSKSVAAVMPRLRQANVPMLAFSNDRQVAGPGSHLIGVMPGPDVARVVSYALAKGKKRFAALIPDDAAGRTSAQQFRDAVARGGGTVVAAELYPVGQPNGMMEPVRRLRDAVRGIEEHGDPVDALFLPGGEESLPALAPHLRNAGFTPEKYKIIGTGALEYASAGREPLLVGAWFAAPEPRDFQAFSEKFARAHGHAPPRIAAIAYDAVAIVVALQGGPKGARFNHADLTRTQGFNGADGSFRLLSDGTSERTLAILEVGKMGTTVVEPAPRDFAPVPVTSSALVAPAPTTVASSQSLN